MTWNLAPEVISGILLLILILYFHNDVRTNTTRDRMFHIACYTSLGSIIVNLFSSYLLLNYTRFPFVLTIAMTTLYYILTPLVPILYVFYIVITLYHNYSYERMEKKWYLLAMPYLLYLIVLLLNPLLHNVFCVIPNQGYVRQRLYMMPYLLFYLYCVIAVVLTLHNRKKTERRVFHALMIFPLLSFLFIFFQSAFQEIILTGTAAFTSLFIMYLYLQNIKLVADELTGLLNRKTLLRTLETRIKNTHPFSLLLLSLNNFKTINDRFGTAFGDQFLQAVADYLKKQLPESSLFRYSGDQFLIVGEPKLINVSLANSLIKRFEESWRTNGPKCLLSANMIIADFPENGDAPETLLGELDYALIYLKQQGSPGLLHCESSMRKAALRKEQVKECLTNAIQSDGFEVFYQPIWSVQDQCFRQAEALLRMKPTELGTLYPDEFIQVAEKTGQIVDITYLVIEKVCADIRHLDESGFYFDSVSVNFSFLQFLQPNLKERMISILACNGVKPSRLKIEITERTLIEDVQIVTDFMTELQQDGIRFCLDDFGTGYSNLETIMRLPLDVIKLDQSLLSGLLVSSQHKELMKHLIQGFHSLNLWVVAEGVETEHHKDIVLDLKCDAIQGYLFARPMSLQNLLHFANKSCFQFHQRTALDH